MKASELSWEQKSHIKSELMKQIGYQKYLDMEKALGGEDAVLEIVAQKVNEAEAAEKKEKDNFWWTVGVVIGAIIGVAMAVGAYKSEGIGSAIEAFLMSTFLLGPLLAGAIRYLPQIGAVAVACAGLGIVGYVMWKAITFTAGGTVTWFQWLFGHF